LGVRSEISSADLIEVANVAKLEVKEGPVRFVRDQPVGTAELVPQTRPDPLPVSEGNAAGPVLADRRSRPSTADLAAAYEVCW
jgi:hypothetical protein